MGASSFPDLEGAGGELGGYQDEAVALPPSHTEGLSYAEEPTLGSAAYDLYGNEDLFGAGLHQEWDSIVGSDSAEEAFRSAYEAYVTDPATLHREAPDQYRFLKENVFYGLEYRHGLSFHEQVGEGIEALKQIEACRPEVYEGLSVHERVEALRQMEIRLAECQGRPPCPVVMEQLKPGHCGTFDPQTGTIYLNENFVTDPRQLTEAVNTVAHEGRHAYQHYAIQHPGFHPDADQVRAWSDNFRDYLRIQDWGDMLYRNQPVEADAFSFGEAIRDGLYGGQQS